MFQRFHEMRERGAKGFTLIELLVVILIIAILAAIAIPIFLRQREKGWVSQVESALKNAATAQESHLVETSATGAGAYATTEAELVAQGFNRAGDVTMVEPFNTATGTWYCMEATHANLGTRTWSFDSGREGAPVEQACAVAAP